MNKTIRLNKRTLITFELPYIDITKYHINLEFTNKLYLQCFNYDLINRAKLNKFYNIDFEIYLWGFGISIETIVNKNKIDNIISSSKKYFSKIKQLTTKKSHEY